MTEPVRDDGEFVFVDIDASTFTPKPLEGAARQRAEAYLEKIKKYRPEEYEQILKEREACQQRF